MLDEHLKGTYYIGYEDDGMSGAGGQTMQNMGSHSGLYVYDVNDQDQYDALMILISKTDSCRAKAKITGMWHNASWNNEVVPMKFEGGRWTREYEAR